MLTHCWGREGLVPCTSWSTCSPAYYSARWASRKFFQTWYYCIPGWPGTHSLTRQGITGVLAYSFPFCRRSPSLCRLSKPVCPPGLGILPRNTLLFSSHLFQSFGFYFSFFSPLRILGVELRGFSRPVSSALKACLQSPLPAPCPAFKPQCLRALGL